MYLQSQGKQEVGAGQEDAEQTLSTPHQMAVAMWDLWLLSRGSLTVETYNQYVAIQALSWTPQGQGTQDYLSHGVRSSASGAVP